MPRGSTRARSSASVRHRQSSSKSRPADSASWKSCTGFTSSRARRAARQRLVADHLRGLEVHDRLEAHREVAREDQLEHLARAAPRMQAGLELRVGARVIDRVHDLTLGLDGRIVQRDRDAHRKLERLAQVRVHDLTSLAPDLARDAVGEAANPRGVEARVAARLEHEDEDRAARALLGDQQVLGRNRLERDLAHEAHEAVHRLLVGGAAVAALDALERPGLDQEQPDGPSAGEARHDPIQFLVPGGART